MVWDSFAQGMEIGGALRARRNRLGQGQAFNEGGLDAASQAAAGQGDMEAALGYQDQQRQQQSSALETATRNMTVLSNAATSLMGVPYEQRAARLQQMRPMLAQMGLPDEQISGFDPTDEALANIRGMAGHFSQYADIQEQDGAILGIRPDGSIEVLREAPGPQFELRAGMTRATRVNPQTGEIETGPNQAPLRGRGGGGAGGIGPGGIPSRAPPAGYRWTPGGNLEPVPGGPADIRQTESGRRQTSALMDSADNLQNTLDAIDQAAAIRTGTGDANPFNDATGFMGGVMRGVGGSAAHDLQQALEPILANVGFEALAEMRRNSQTGGALGQVAVREIELLQRTVRSLEQTQSDEQFRANLANVRGQVARTLQAVRNAQAEMARGPNVAQQPAQPAQAAPGAPRRIRLRPAQ